MLGGINMKKILVFSLSLVLIVFLFACSTTIQAETPAKPNYTNDVKGTLINNQGDPEFLTAKELCDLSDGNNISFEKKYWCAYTTVIGKINEIEGACSINGTHYDWTVTIDGGACDWFIGKTKYNTSTVTENFLADLNVGDTVEISGEIVGASFNEVDLSNGTISVKKVN